MERVTVEVCPRVDEREYHACLQGQQGIWGHGKSVEEAVISFLGTHHTDLRLSTNDMETARSQDTVNADRRVLRKLVGCLSEREFELDIRFLPNEIR